MSSIATFAPTGSKRTITKRPGNAGVIFIRFDQEKEPRVEKGDDGLQVTVPEPMLHDDLLIRTDLLVLSPGIVAPHENEGLSKMLKVPLNADGFFLEAHMKLRPVDFATEGIFLAGLAHSPKSIDETLSQANAAVARALTLSDEDAPRNDRDHLGDRREEVRRMRPL